MSRTPIPVKLASDQEQIASAQEEGLEACKRQGHLRGKHYNTEQNRIEFRCNRCGRLLGIEKER